MVIGGNGLCEGKVSYTFLQSSCIYCTRMINLSSSVQVEPHKINAVSHSTWY